MLRYIAKRLVYIVFVFFVVSILMFGIYKSVPGDPVAMQLDGKATSMTPEQYQLLYDQTRERLGLDKPIYVQYAVWITDMMQGNFGISSIHRLPVITLVAEPMKNTILLNFASLFFVFLITIPLGIATAVRKGSKFDTAVQVGTIVGYSMPSFVVALIAIVIFAVKFPVFPISGVNTAGLTGSDWVMFKDKMFHMALPLIVMTVSSLGSITRYVRAAMIEALSMDYIRTARAKGLKEKVVIYSHAFRNALIPVVTIITAWFVGIFSGSVVIETIFLWNGMGKILLDSLLKQDFAVVLAMQMFYVILTLAGNLLMDIAYGLVDPRVKLS